MKLDWVDPPAMFRLRRRFEGPRIDDPAAAVAEQLQTLQLANQVKPGQSVAITAGSRGIANLAVIVKAIVDHFRSLGAEPFIVPAMGSHGGGTAEGQTELLAGYNVTEAFCGAPIRASMETVVVGEAPQGFPIHFDRLAHEADHVFVCNRVKPHTGLEGAVESGLTKMLLIGLGKHAGAKIYHRAFQEYSWEKISQVVAGMVLERRPVVGALAIVENSYDETAIVRALPAREILSQEPALLQKAYELIPRLPFERLDVLVIDQIGKNISGTGMDTNVVGRKYNDRAAREDEFPKIRRILVRGLTEATHGNASGIGLADLCHRRAAEQTNHEITAINCITAGHISGGMTPITLDSDREMLTAALNTIGLRSPREARVCWIKDTLHLSEIECSEALLAEVRDLAGAEVVAAPRTMPLDEHGDWPAFDAAAAIGPGGG